MNPLIVVGSAPCLYEDFEAALSIYPTADVMLINEAAGALPEGDHILAGHTVKAELFAAYRREKFPDCRPFRVHANWTARKEPPPKAMYPSVTDWWGADVSSGATSAGKAIRIGLKLGYSPIVLCGCPMNGGGYFNESETARFDLPKFGKCRRVGFDKEQSHRTIVRYRETFKKLAETEWKGKVFSMSGYTRELLGAPACS